MYQSMHNHFRLLATLLILALNSASAHEPESTAHYLANEGVMIVRGETKILFDPLFRISYGQYQMMPKDMEAAATLVRSGALIDAEDPDFPRVGPSP